MKKKFLLVNTTCILDIYKKSENKQYYVVKGYCHVKGCKHFLFKINKKKNIDGNIGVQVYSNYLHFKHGKDETGNIVKRTGYVKDVERELVAEMLQNEKPSKFREISVNNASVTLIKHCGNLQNIKSDDVARKIKSELLAKHDDDKNELYNILLLPTVYPEYVRLAGNPFFVFICSKEQLDVCKFLKKQGPLTLHLDSTGSVVRPPPSLQKKVFYYAGVIHIPSLKRVFPVMEMINSNHDAISIGQWFLEIKKIALVERLKWPIFDKIVVDFSFALLNAICHYWLHYKDLLTYINTCYAFIVQGIGTLECTLHVCCCHFAKIIRDDVNKFMRNLKKREIIKEAIFSLFNMDDLENMKLWFYHFTILTMSPTGTTEVQNSLKFISNLACNSTDTFDFDVIETKDNYIPDDNAIYKNSKFYAIFVDIFTEANSHINNLQNEGLVNDFYCPELVNIKFKKYIPYLPLWSGLLSKSDSRVVRQSNAVVEDWFKHIKTEILRGDKNLRCNRFVSTVRDRVLSMYKETLLGIGKNGCARGKKRKLKPDDDLQCVETWIKRSKARKKSYFDVETLKKLATASTPQPTENVLTKSNSNTPGNRFNNGLFENPHYYVNSKFKFIVANFENCHSPIKEVTSDDYRTLFVSNNSMDMWITNFLMDICMHIVIGNLNKFVQILTSLDAISFFNNPGDCKHIKFQSKICIMPVLINNNHWCLAVADFPKKQFYFYNPYKSTELETINYFNIFLKHFKNKTQRNEWTWKVNDCHATQKDSFNCGIYIIQFAVKIAKEESLLEIIPCNEYRNILKTLILKESDNMTDKCLACGRVELNVTADWVQCDTCERWLHTHCIPKDTPNRRYSLVDEIFLCPLCLALSS